MEGERQVFPERRGRNAGRNDADFFAVNANFAFGARNAAIDRLEFAKNAFETFRFLRFLGFFSDEIRFFVELDEEPEARFQRRNFGGNLVSV